jgi:hypothetical protein
VTLFFLAPHHHTFKIVVEHHGEAWALFFRRVHETLALTTPWLREDYEAALILGKSTILSWCGNRRGCQLHSIIGHSKASCPPHPRWHFLRSICCCDSFPDSTQRTRFKANATLGNTWQRNINALIGFLLDLSDIFFTRSLYNLAHLTILVASLRTSELTIPLSHLWTLKYYFFRQVCESILSVQVESESRMPWYDSETLVYNLAIANTEGLVHITPFPFINQHLASQRFKLRHVTSLRQHNVHQHQYWNPFTSRVHCSVRRYDPASLCTLLTWLVGWYLSVWKLLLTAFYLRLRYCPPTRLVIVLVCNHRVSIFSSLTQSFWPLFTTDNHLNVSFVSLTAASVHLGELVL